MTALQLVDRSEMVVFDLDDPTGAANPHSLKTRLRRLDLGAPNRDATLFSPSSVPGAIRTRVKHGAVVGQAVLSVESTSSDLLLAGHGELARLLEMDGIALRLQANGQTSARLIEVADATLDRLLRGEDREGFFRFAQFYDDELGITFVRQPFLRGAELDSDTNKLKNPTMLKLQSSGTPQDWEFADEFDNNVILGTPTYDTDTESWEVAIDAAQVPGHIIQQRIDASEGETFTFSIEAMRVAGIGTYMFILRSLDAAGAQIAGSAVETAGFGDAAFTRRSLTIANLPAGTAKVLVTIRGADGAGTFRFRRAQLELGSTATSFVTSSESVPNDPAGQTWIPPAPAAPTAANAVNTPGNVNGGTHSWKVSFVINPTNLAENPGFELDTGWDEFPNTDWLLTVTGVARTGLKALRTAGTSGVSEKTSETRVSVSPGQEFYAEAWAGTTGAGATGTVRISLRWSDASDVFLSNTHGATVDLASLTPGTYVKMIVTAAAPAGAAYCRVKVGGATAITGLAYIDDVLFGQLVGESLPSPASNVVTIDGDAATGGNQNGQCNLTIPIGRADVTFRKVYRTVTGNTGNYKLVGTMPNNTATTYVDNVADASLGVDAPTAAPNTTAETVGRLYPIYIQGDAPTPVTFELVGDAGAHIQCAHLASLSALKDGGKSLAHFVNGPRVVQCDDADFTHTVAEGAGGFVTGSVVTDAEASNGQAVSYTGTSITSTYKRQLRVELDDTDLLEGFRGTFEWKLRLAVTGTFHVEAQLRWADSLEEPATLVNLPVRHNTNIDGLAEFGYVELNLGKTSLPIEGTLDGLALEIWMKSIFDGDELRLDCLIASPTEQSATLALPYTGRAVVVEDNVNATLGNKLGANTWRVTWRYSIQTPNASFVIALRIRRDTQSSGTIVRELQKDHPSDITNVMASVEFDSISGVSYFVDTDTFAGSATTTVHEIIVEKVGWIEGDESLVTDPNLGVERAYKLTTTGRLAVPALVGGPMPFWLEPGLHLVYVEVFEPRIGGLYSELKSELRRRETLSHRYAPRYPA